MNIIKRISPKNVFKRIKIDEEDFGNSRVRAISFDSLTYSEHARKEKVSLKPIFKEQNEQFSNLKMEVEKVERSNENMISLFENIHFSLLSNENFANKMILNKHPINCSIITKSSLLKMPNTKMLYNQNELNRFDPICSGSSNKNLAKVLAKINLNPITVTKSSTKQLIFKHKDSNKDTNFLKLYKSNNENNENKNGEDNDNKDNKYSKDYTNNHIHYPQTTIQTINTRYKNKKPELMHKTIKTGYFNSFLNRITKIWRSKDYVKSAMQAFNNFSAQTRMQLLTKRNVETFNMTKKFVKKSNKNEFCTSKNVVVMFKPVLYQKIIKKAVTISTLLLNRITLKLQKNFRKLVSKSSIYKKIGDSKNNINEEFADKYEGEVINEDINEITKIRIYNKTLSEIEDHDKKYKDENQTNLSLLYTSKIQLENNGRVMIKTLIYSQCFIKINKMSSINKSSSRFSRLYLKVEKIKRSWLNYISGISNKKSLHTQISHYSTNRPVSSEVVQLACNEFPKLFKYSNSAYSQLNSFSKSMKLDFKEKITQSCYLLQRYFKKYKLKRTNKDNKESKEKKSPFQNVNDALGKSIEEYQNEVSRVNYNNYLKLNEEEKNINEVLNDNCNIKSLADKYDLSEEIKRLILKLDEENSK